MKYYCKCGFRCHVYNNFKKHMNHCILNISQISTLSQMKQDLNVIYFFNKMKNGFFVDIGANDGITMSNTCILEKNYNWTGICSEPLLSAFKKLKQIRNCFCDNNAVFSKSNLILPFSNCELLSGITEFIDTYKNVKNSKQTTVKTITFQDLLKKYNAPKIINYLSLDTEGSELEILKSVNFSEYKFLYINVEHNYSEPRRTNIRSLLENNGYLYKGENYLDDDYIHESIIIGTYYYNKDYTKPILIKRNKIIVNMKFSVSSPYWKDDIGEFKDGSINWNRLGKGKIFYNYIDYGNRNKWYKK